jgi:hypothetical protein
MKIFVFVMTMMISTVSFGAWNELECDGYAGNKAVRLEVERPFPNGSYFRRAQLFVTQDGKEIVTNFSLTPRVNPTFGRIEYWGGGLKIEVNIWPDQYPRWGWTYFGRLETSVIDNWSPFTLDCMFPNAF